MRSITLAKLNKIRGAQSQTTIWALLDLPGFGTCVICGESATEQLSVTAATYHTREQEYDSGYGTTTGLCQECAKLLPVMSPGIEILAGPFETKEETYIARDQVNPEGWSSSRTPKSARGFDGKWYVIRDYVSTA